jgi:GTP-binding protein
MMPDTMDATEEKPAPLTRIAIVGKPNVGKSSIVNRMLGSDQQIVTDVPGTTRDAIDTIFKYHGKEYVLIDTAGLRRKTKVTYGVEYFSVMRTIEAVDRADIVVLVLTADEEISMQDIKIASYAKRKMKEIMIAYNNGIWYKDTHSTKNFLEELHFKCHSAVCPVPFISPQPARHQPRDGADVQIEDESQKRISTSELNRFRRGCGARLRLMHCKHVKIYYMTRACGQAPLIFFCQSKPMFRKIPPLFA